MRLFEKKAFLAIIKRYCIETTAHGFKYIVSETAFVLKTLWVGSFSQPKLIVVMEQRCLRVENLEEGVTEVFAKIPRGRGCQGF